MKKIFLMANEEIYGFLVYTIKFVNVSLNLKGFC